ARSIHPVTFGRIAAGPSLRGLPPADSGVVAPASRFIDAALQDSDANDAEESEENGASGESLAPLQDKELTIAVNVVNTSISDIGTGLLPDAESDSWDQGLQMLPDGAARGASYKCVHWRPSLVFHHPLHFEDAMLERHGHNRWGHLQPLASGAKFFGTIVLHPYLHTLNRPWECQYALGHYRPGTCAPVLKDHLPWDRRAAAVETLALAGFFWAAPL
ncbi:MAG: hypothetical protein AAGG44_13240, partial [Planctomycetota bacterium]